MVAGAAHTIIQGPGKVILNPNAVFDGGTYPYGGKEIGLVQKVRLDPLGEGKVIWNEGLGEPTNLLDSPNDWVMSFEVRGWDNDAVEELFPGNRTAGAVTQHSVFTVPGTRTPGQSGIDALESTVVFVPDDLIHHQALIAYRAVPRWIEGFEINFSRTEELLLGVAFQLFRDATNDNTFRIGRLPDLGLT